MRAYVGRFSRVAPDGTLHTGCDSADSIIERLKETEKKLNDGEVLSAWGFDDIYFPGEAFSRETLDKVSTTRPILLAYASGHVILVNSKVLADTGITRDTMVEGVVKDDAGEPTGVLQEMEAMFLAKDFVLPILNQATSAQAVWNFGYSMRNAGITTATDLGTTDLLDTKLQKVWSTTINDPLFPCRVNIVGGALACSMRGHKEDELGPIFKEIDARLSNDKQIWCKRVKFMADGSIQGWTARMDWPGYITGVDHGISNIPVARLNHLVKTYHEAGFGIHCHCNGSSTITDFLNAVEMALETRYRPDARHVVEHTQVASQAQYRRIKNLGLYVNIFSNHIFYVRFIWILELTNQWGDEHYNLTIGPDRAESMNGAGSAVRHGVTFALHSDTPVTPAGGLHLVGAAVNRLTVSGKVLGVNEQISVVEALKAVTINPAILLKMDHLVGSLECGKFADVVILESDPQQVPPAEIKDIRVWGTMLGGEIFQCPS
jgi:predicted amidohydrolase YtcJ